MSTSFRKGLALALGAKFNIDVFDIKHEIDNAPGDNPSVFAEHIISLVSSEYGIDITKVKLELDSFMKANPFNTSFPTTTPSTSTTLAPTVQSPASVAPKKTASASKPVKSVCGYVVKGKNGEHECGVGAQYEFEGTTYCKKHHDSQVKKKVNSVVELTPPPSRQTTLTGGFARESATVSQTKPQPEVAPILQKIAMKKELQFHEVPAGSGKFIDVETRILFDRKPPHEAYGLLASDNQTILPLGNDQIRFLETHNLKFRHLSMTKDNQTQSKTASDQIKKCEDEEILDANEDDEDVAEEVVEEEGVEEDEELNADEEEEEGEVEEVEEEEEEEDDDGEGEDDDGGDGEGDDE
jgi:hypothetical protein